MTAQRTPTFPEVLASLIESRLVDVHTMLPGQIESYDSAKQTVNVKITVQRRLVDEDGTKTLVDLPPLQNVPVAFPRCAGGWITFPLAKGDNVMVIFSERSLGQWMAKDNGQQIDPQEVTLHPLSGAVAVPGLYPSTAALRSPSTQHVVVHTESELHLGEKGLAAANALAFEQKVLENLNKLKTALTTATYVNVAGTPTTLVVAPPVVFVDMATTKVRAK